jgi:hypothetical protein
VFSSVRLLKDGFTDLKLHPDHKARARRRMSRLEQESPNG